MSVLMNQPPLPVEAEQYAGKWVAVREGEIVAAADDFDALVGDERVRDTDALYHVPEPDTYFY